MMKFQYNDGGRKAAGYKGSARDCVVRAIAIAADLPYKKVYKDLFKLTGKSPKNSVGKKATKTYLDSIGWKWTPTMKIGQGCKVHLKEDELPKGRIIASVSKHLTCIIDGVINDTHDPQRNGSRCVYGYWKSTKANHTAPKGE